MVNKDSKVVTLVRDGSDLSDEAQNFLDENNIEYNIQYQFQERGERPLPRISDGMGNCYAGERGLKWYKGIKKSA
jgi:hypothetical protein